VIRDSHLSLAISPEIDAHANEIVERGIGTLIEQHSNQSGERVEDQAGLDGTVQGGAGDEAQRPFVGHAEDSEEQVHDLEGGNGLYGAVEVLGGEVPEDLGPEEAVEAGADLVWIGYVSMVIHD